MDKRVQRTKEGHLGDINAELHPLPLDHRAYRPIDITISNTFPLPVTINAPLLHLPPPRRFIALQPTSSFVTLDQVRAPRGDEMRTLEYSCYCFCSLSNDLGARSKQSLFRSQASYTKHSQDPHPSSSALFLQLCTRVPSLPPLAW